MASLGHFAYEALSKHLRKISKHEPGVIRDRDPEAIHQMRVGLRRLRTALEVFAPALTLPKGVTPKRVRDVAGCLSPVRDLDVMTAELKERYYPQLPKVEQQQLAKLIKKLDKRREEHLQKSLHLLRGDRYRKLHQGLQEWLAQPLYQPLATMPVTAIAPDLLLPLIGHLLLHAGWQVEVAWQGEDYILPEKTNIPPLLNQCGDLLHELRKQIKRVRYQMELFTPLYSPSYAEQVTEFSHLQDLLGTLHDGVVLNTFFLKQLGLNLSKASPALAQLIEQQQTQQWQDWRGVQADYLHPSRRHQLRQLFLQDPEQTVISSNGHTTLEPTPQPINP